MTGSYENRDEFTRDMGYSETEFFRVLPRAIREYTFSKAGRIVTITHPDNNHELVLSVAPLPNRILGNFRIARVEVRFSFRNFSAAERMQFMAGFDRSFQRGGG